MNVKVKTCMYNSSSAILFPHNHLLNTHSSIPHLRTIMHPQQLTLPHIPRKNIRRLDIRCIRVENTVSLPLFTIPQRRNPPGMMLGNLVQKRQRCNRRLLRNLKRCGHESFGKTAQSDGRWDTVCAGEKGRLETAEEEHSGGLEVDFVL